MNHLFVPVNIAIKLKEIGFDEPCFAGYQPNHKNIVTLYFKSTKQNGTSTTPSTYGKYCHQNNHVVKAALYQQVFDWFREKGYNSGIFEENRNDWGYHAGLGTHDTIGGIVGYETYEEAQNECILNLIEQYEKSN